MIRRLNGNIGHVIRHYNDWENLQKSLHKVHDFYHAHELQKGVVNKDKNSELAISLKGNFSRGINLDEEEEKKEEPGRISRAYTWIKEKLCCKKEEKKEENSSEKSEVEKVSRCTRALKWAKAKMCCKKIDEEKTEKSKEAQKDEKKGNKNKRKKISNKKAKRMKNKQKAVKKEDEKEKKAQCLNDIITLKDIDLQIKKGEFVCIIGEIGSGKSTLLLSMLGELLYVPQSEIDIVGGNMKRKLTGKEREAMNDALQNIEINSKDSPVQLNGSVSYVEQ